MSKRSIDLTDGLEDLFASQGVAQEKSINPYAAASQPSGFGRLPVQLPETTPSRQPTNSPSDADIAPTTNVVEQATVPLAHSGSGAASATPTPRMMTVEEVASYLAISVSAVWRRPTKDPDFPRPIKIGGSTRWDKQAIDRYLDARGRDQKTRR